MDENTHKMLQEMDVFGGHAMTTAMRAEELGLPIPFYIIEVLVRGRPLSRFIEGPAMRAELHIPHMPVKSDIDDFQNKMYQATNGMLHQQPMHADQQIHRVVDPSYWHLSFND